MIKMLESIVRRLQLMIARSVINSVSDSGGIQSAQVLCLSQEVHDDVQRIQQYGFTSNPKPGAQAITLFFGGNREDGVIICTDDKRYRLRSLQPGEVALYTDEGDSIQLKRNNEIKITSSGTVKIECDDVEIGGGTMRKLIDERMIDIFNTHIHASSGVVPSTLITVPSTVTTTKTAAS